MEGRKPRLAFIGEGDSAKSWLRALETLADVEGAPRELDELDGLVIAPGAYDPFARAKEALQRGLPVLYASPFLLSPWQTNVLTALARRRRLLLRFAERFRYRPGFSFLRRVLQGKEPFWRPLYLRTLCLAQEGRIDELATEELAVCVALLEGIPQSMTAAASRKDETGDVCSAFLILQYDDGPLAQCTISLAESTAARQLVAVTAGRTVVIDDLDPIASVRVVGGEHEPLDAALGLRPGATERLLTAPSPDPVVEETRRFVEALSTNDVSTANGERWIRVAALWWAARQSMTFGGPTEVPMPSLPAQTEPPPLRVIRGGGKTARTAGRRPALTLVAS